MRQYSRIRNGRIGVPLFTAALIASGVLTSRAQVQTADELLVSVDATGLPEGALTTLTNTGTLGGVFVAPEPDNAPTVATVGGTKGIQLDGNDFFQLMTGPDEGLIYAPAGLVGQDPTRTIEVWAVNPEIANEETLVSWGRRGGPAGSNLSFNYGDDPRWGAVGHNGNPDIGWNNQGGAPRAGQWHHLVYTYDGTTTRLYADGVLQNGEYLGPGAIITHEFTPILIAAQTEPDGLTINRALGLSGSLGRVRVHDGVLTPEQVLANYNAERSAFIDPVIPPPETVSPERLEEPPAHRYSFNSSAGDATGATLEDSAGTADGTVLGEGATFTGSRLALPGGASDTAAYGDLPNGLLSSNSSANGGSGQFTFETWVRLTGPRTWSRVFDFGSSGGGDENGEIFGPGGSGNGLDYFVLIAQVDVNVNMRRLEIRNNEDTGDESELVNVPTQTFMQDTHLVATWDEATGEVHLYENGVQVGEFIADDTMEDINDVNVWLGRSNWLADQNAQAEFDEVRLYDYTLSPGQVLGNFQSGPEVINNTDVAVTVASNPEDITVEETQNATFRFGASGSTPVTFQWFRNGVAIPGATNSTLTLTNVTAADNNAEFTVSASNTVNGAPVTVTSEAATLTVLTPDLTLRHRYSFNETSGTTVADLVGDADATVYAGASGTDATLGGGELTLGGIDGYADLPNGIITGLGADGTIELWFTQQSSTVWSRIFDFGISDAGEDAQGGGVDFLFFTPRMGEGWPSFRANFPGPGGDIVVLEPAPPGWIPGNEPTHVVITWSASGNTARMFIDGQLVASGLAPRPLSEMNNQDVNNWLGRSQFIADANWGGSYDELRLYSGAMSPSRVQASFAAGPDELTGEEPDQPELSATISGNNLVITWPDSATGFTLESSPTLGAGANWTPVPNVTPNGGQMQATVPLDGQARFFRLTSE